MKKVLIIIAVVAVSAVAIFFYTQGPLPTSQEENGSMKGVYNPGRLKILDPDNPIRTVTGTVEKVIKAPDGDYHIETRLYKEYLSLLNKANYNKVSGDLILEVVPSDQFRTPIPKVGDKINATGVWVLDTNHDWNELHPVRGIIILR